MTFLNLGLKNGSHDFLQAWFLSLVNMQELFGGLSLFFTGGLLLVFKGFCDSNIRESVFFLTAAFGKRHVSLVLQEGLNLN
jgi:hypothetical protein